MDDPPPPPEPPRRSQTWISPAAVPAITVCPSHPKRTQCTAAFEEAADAPGACSVARGAPAHRASHRNTRPLRPDAANDVPPAPGAKHTSSKPAPSALALAKTFPVPTPAPPLDTARAVRPTRASSTSTTSESGDVVARNALSRKTPPPPSPSPPFSSPPPPHATEDTVLCMLPLSPSPRRVHLGWNRSPSETRSVSKGRTHKPPDAHAAARNEPLASNATETAGSPYAAAAVVSRRARGRCVTPSSCMFVSDNPNASARRSFVEASGRKRSRKRRGFRFRASRAGKTFSASEDASSEDVSSSTRAS